MAKASATDQAVRDYLLYLDDPEQLVDRELVAILERRMAEAQDPLERLVAIAEYERARHPAEDVYRAAFIEHAKQWANQHQVPPHAFRQLGVSDEVLEAAGLQRMTTEPSSTKSKKTTGVEELESALERMPSTFRARDLTDAAGGGSPMTVRKALSRLTDAGRIQRLGPDPEWSEKGRAPILYQRMD